MNLSALGDLLSANWRQQPVRLPARREWKNTLLPFNDARVLANRGLRSITIASDGVVRTDLSESEVVPSEATGAAVMLGRCKEHF